MTRGNKLTITEKILLLLQDKHCLSLEELERYTGVKKETLLVYLTRLADRDIISRTWGSFGGKKYRKYCLKTKVREDLGLD